VSSDRPKDPALVAREPERILALWRTFARAVAQGRCTDPTKLETALTSVGLEIDEFATEALLGLWNAWARAVDRATSPPGEAMSADAVRSWVDAILHGEASPMYDLTVGEVEAVDQDGQKWRLRVHTPDGHASFLVERADDDGEPDETTVSAAVVTDDACEIALPDEVPPDIAEALVHAWRERARRAN